MSAATQLHEIVSQHLGTKTKASVADLLGVTPQSWGAYLRGRSPRESTIDEWLERCRSAGIEVPPSVAAAVVGRFTVVAREEVTHHERLEGTESVPLV